MCLIPLIAAVATANDLEFGTALLPPFTASADSKADVMGAVATAPAPAPIFAPMAAPAGPPTLPARAPPTVEADLIPLTAC